LIHLIHLKIFYPGLIGGDLDFGFLLGFEMSVPPSMTMTRTDYEKILSYYKVPFDKLSHHELKKKAEDILATKLCKCIKAAEKKVGTQSAIALCTASVFRKKGLKYFDMSCKGRSQLQSRKGRKLAKTRKNII
jgi:hypothetical protein